MRRLRVNGSALAVAVALAVTGVSAGAGAISRVGSDEAVDTTALVLPVKVAEVDRVTVASAKGTVTLRRTGDGEWAAGPGAPAQSADLIFTFEERLFPLRAYRTLPEAQTSFGLEDPEITFTVEDTDGGERVIAFGSPTFTDGGFYARRDGSPTVYLVPKRMMNDLRSLVAGRQMDAENSLPAKIAELDAAAKSRADAAETGFWLQQSIDAGTPIPEELE